MNAGLYVLRYLGGVDLRNAPFATVAPSSSSIEAIDVINAPGIETGEMAGPGSSLVLVARRPGSVDVTVQSLTDSPVLDAKFSLDLIAPAAAPQNVSTVARRESTPARPAVSSQDNDAGARAGGVPTVEISAHVARRGDIVADAEGWIAGPRAPSAVEGFMLRCVGARVGVMAQFMSDLDPRRWSDWQQPGVFVGTRQKASPLTGLRFRLSGEEASRFEIEAEALFLGSPLVSQKGAEVELLSASGVDPLVGLKINIVPSTVQISDTPDVRRSRVRVFR